MSEFTVPEHLPDWISNHVRLYLGSGGKEGHLWDSTVVGGPGPLPCLLLLTKGRKSGKKITVPLIYGETGKGSYVIVASRGGTPTHPDWYLNLTAEPEVKIQVGTERMTAVARTCGDAERDELWKQMAKIYPPYDAYQASTQRRIPVVVLDPKGPREKVAG
jgi:deazaflavin-dependent oxidoreductase (nitroreductase family)